MRFAHRLHPDSALRALLRPQLLRAQWLRTQAPHAQRALRAAHGTHTPGSWDAIRDIDGAQLGPPGTDWRPNSSAVEARLGGTSHRALQGDFVSRGAAKSDSYGLL